MSSRSGLILLLVGLIVVVYLLQSGKLATAWAAIWSGTGVPGAGGTGSAGTVPPGEVQTNPAGPLPPAPGASSVPSSLFGIPAAAVRAFVDPATNPYFRSLDSQETQGSGGGPTVSELDYLLGSGVSLPVWLPSGGNYTVLDNRTAAQTGGVGGILTVRTPGGGVLSFLHLLNQVDAPVGSTLSGGQTIGNSGWPQAPSYGVGGSYGPSNALVAVAADQGGLAFLEGHG